MKSYRTEIGLKTVITEAESKSLALAELKKKYSKEKLSKCKVFLVEVPVKKEVLSVEPTEEKPFLKKLFG